MKKVILVLGLLFTAPSYAQSPAASEASIRELMTLTNSKSLLDGVYGQLDGLMEKAMKDALAGKSVNADQEKLMAEMRARTVDIFREEMSWEKLEPGYLELYRTTFSQSEIEGMIGFYKTDAGKAVIGKMPLMMQNVMQMMMTRMQSLTPRISSLTEEYVAKLKAAGGKSGE
jgi:hypothetical protein